MKMLLSWQINELSHSYYDYSCCGYDYTHIDVARFKKALPWWQKYAQLLPYSDPSGVKSLGECATPLIASKRFEGVYFKDETRNPSGCFKDRESAVLIPYLIEQGHRKFAVASSGNAALSAALYTKLYGAQVLCAIPHGTSIAKKKLIALFGGRIISLGTHYEDCHRRLVDDPTYHEYINITAGVNSLKDQGDKLIAYEIWEQYGVPDFVIVPVGNGCLLGGIYKGFEELMRLQITARMPAFIGVQIKNADPVHQAHVQGKDFVKLWSIPNSRAEGIVALESFSSPKVIAALRATKGFMITVNEKELKKGMHYAVAEEGQIPEWTAAAAFAALLKVKRNAQVPANATIVVLNSGNGLKEILDIAKVMAV